jgi:hypothetical protein
MALFQILKTCAATFVDFPAVLFTGAQCYLYLSYFTLYLYTNSYSLLPNSSSSLSSLFTASDDKEAAMSIPLPSQSHLSPTPMAVGQRWN